MNSDSVDLTERCGYKVVPLLLTQGMLEAGLNARNPELQLHLSGSAEAHRMRRQVERMWRAMLAAAPAAEARQPDEQNRTEAP